VLDTRIDRLGRRRYDDLNARKELVRGVKTVLIALVVLDREKRRVLPAQNVRVVVRQVKDTSSRAVIRLGRIDRGVRNGLVPKGNYHGITIYPTNTIYCFNRINSIRSDHQCWVCCARNWNSISKPLNVEGWIGYTRIQNNWSSQTGWTWI